MFTLLYFLIFIYSLGLLWSYNCERIVRLDVAKRRAEDKGPEILTIGKKVTSFTVEKFFLVQESSVYTISIFRRPIYWLCQLLFPIAGLFKDMKEIAMQDCILKLKEKCPTANYIANFRLQFNRINMFSVEISTQGTAIQLYPDSLGLFNVPIKQVSYNRSSINFECFFKTLSVACSLVLFAYAVSTSESKVKEYLVSNLTEENKRSIWHYFQDDINNHRSSQDGFVQAEKLATEILNALSPDKHFIVMVTNNDKSDAFVYPGGYIVITSGLLKSLKFEKEIEFILAREIAHENLGHNKLIYKDSILTYYFADNIFGHNFLIDWLVTLPAALHFYEYTDEQNIAADRAAIECIKEKTGGFDGLAEFAEHYKRDNWDMYGLRNPLINERLKLFQEHFKEQADAKPRSLMVFKINNNLTRVLLKSGEQHNDFMNLMNDFQELVSRSGNEYAKTTTAYKDAVIKLENNITLDSLQAKQKTVIEAKSFVTQYKNGIFAEMDAINSKIILALNIQKDEQQKRLQLHSWNKSLENARAKVTFECDRDWHVFDTAEIILEFLSKRHGNFTIYEGMVTFSGGHAQEGYNQLMTRMNSYLYAQHREK